MLAITADVHERRSGIPRRLQSLGADVDIRSLTRGDYVVGPDTVVERKTVADLHLSIIRGRLWHQMRKLDVNVRPYLLVEGGSLFAGPLNDDAVRGACLALADLGVTIIRTESTNDSANWLARLARRRQEGSTRARPRFAQRPNALATSPQEAALSAAPGVSTKTARTVLERFGSLAALSNATVEDLTSIRNVGEQRAQVIVALMHDRWNAADAS